MHYVTHHFLLPNVSQITFYHPKSVASHFMNKNSSSPFRLKQNFDQSDDASVQLESQCFVHKKDVGNSTISHGSIISPHNETENPFCA
jgi:hypothetical protein